MGKMTSSLLTLSAGALAYHLASKYDMPSKRNMKKLRKRVMRML
ncbi:MULTISPECIES: YrzQ family protein [unclassified Bacillus (in: firmicutes)]